MIFLDLEVYRKVWGCTRLPLLPLSLSEKGIWDRSYPRFTRGAASVILNLDIPCGTIAPEFNPYARHTTGN